MHCNYRSVQLQQTLYQMNTIKQLGTGSPKSVHKLRKAMTLQAVLWCELHFGIDHKKQLSKTLL